MREGAWTVSLVCGKLCRQSNLLLQGTRPADGLAVDFVVVSDRAQLSEIVRRVRDERLRTNIGNIATLDNAVAAFNRPERRKGKTIIRVRP